MRKSLSPRSSSSLLRLLSVCALLFFCGLFNFALAAGGPTILTEATSTRAIALEAVTFRREPFSLTMPVPFSPDTRNRIVFFVMNLNLLAGEGANALTADAEDATHRHYAFTVENVTPIPGYEWMSQVTARLSDDIGDVGDVLVRINLHGMSSNHVRVAIGHVGGGPTDDATAIITPAPFPAPAPPPVLTPNPFTGPATTSDTVRFLEQATFGPTSAEVTRVQGLGFRAYLSEQFNAPVSGYPTLTLMPTDSAQGCPTGSPTTCARDNYSMYPLQVKFYQNALYANDQLRRRVGWALHEILVVSGRDVNQPSWMSPYLQTLDRNAFGNFRTLLQEITLNPGMGLYLDMLNNTKSNPNENYAREVLQLFSVGLDKLNVDGTPQLDAQGNRIPTYDQTTITNFARVFTGWRLAAPKVTVINGVSNNVLNYQDPMLVTSENNHDTGQKILLNGAVLNAGQNSTTDLNAALDNIFNHPNVGPFIGRQLIQQLVTSNPSPGYVERVAKVFNNNCAGLYPDSPCSGARGDLKAVVTAILLDPEARGDVKTDPSYGRLREPAQYITNILRVCNAKSADLSTNSDGYLNPNSITLDQDVFNPATVFSYYPADYLIPGTNLAGPQFGILSTTTSLRRANFVNTIINTGVARSADPTTGNAPNGTKLDLTTLQSLASDPTALVNELDRLMLHNTMSPGMKTSTINAVASVTASNTLDRARMAIYLVASSSQYQIAR
ncbi:MAG: hypothetical protein QOJ02_2452 [Acidobacteriota bacterium]|jgi:uncharacterized protein (DUF1800 family)|nr:hypothetical protein [Acidobacteriota bacterium]